MLTKEGREHCDRGGSMQTLRNSEQVTHSLTRVAFCVRNGQKAVRIVAGVRVNVDLAVSPVICDFSIEFMLNSVIPIWSLRT